MTTQPPSFSPDPSRKRQRPRNPSLEQQKEEDFSPSIPHSLKESDSPINSELSDHQTLPPSFSPRVDRRAVPERRSIRHQDTGTPTSGHCESSGSRSTPLPGQEVPHRVQATMPPSFQPARRTPLTSPHPHPARSAPASSPRFSGFTPTNRVSPSTVPARSPGRKRRRWPGFLVGVLVTAILIFVGWPAFLIWDANAHLERVSALSAAPDTPGTTWLLAGSDSRADGAVSDGAEGQRSDSIVLIHQAPNGQTSMVSIPRDTYVEIPEYGWSKINAAYSYGGPELLVQTVEKLTTLTVDHYVEIGMGGVAHIVDSLGGIELCMDMDVSDEYSQLNWTAGCHVSDGTTALAFSRMRYADPLGDIGRTQRQRQVISQTVATALSPSTLVHPGRTLSLERAGSSAITVDKNASVLDVARLLLAFKKAQKDQLVGAPPIASLNEQTAAGSSVLLVDTTAPRFFSAMRTGTLTAEDFIQKF
ncbi:LCP family protein [Schaalia sp. lx-100]|uniref:LCP family protein n=1 Tax=Schaalia sp. lx-100 TaxID=2899081 RepID=UPI001E510FFB|nr:LCP family protein [Schaalia sp. lx-100]MCD4556764.1 LCP family protein [Schaalia sp. lx-100]